MNQTSFEEKVAEDSPPATRAKMSDDEWVIVGVCSGAIVLPENEVANFHKGYRTAILWLSIPTAVVAIVFAILA